MQACMSVGIRKVTYFMNTSPSTQFNSEACTRHETMHQLLLLFLWSAGRWCGCPGLLGGVIGRVCKDRGRQRQASCECAAYLPYRVVLNTRVDRERKQTALAHAF
jgi:hypothetical protein